MRLFDDEFIKNLPSFDNFSNPSVVAICKKADPSLIFLRSQIEKWFQNLPEAEKKGIYKRIRSLNVEEHQSAFYELLFHQYFLEEDWKVEKNPIVNGLTPDFLISTDSGTSFYVEIFGLFDSRETYEKEKNFYALLRLLDKIEMPFIISVHLREWLEKNADIFKIVDSVRDNLSKLDKTEDKNQKFSINKYGISAGFNARYYPGEKKRCIYAFSGPGGSINPPLKKIKGILNNKLKKYKFAKAEKKPFVLIATTDNYLFPETAIEWALYGLDVISFPIHNPEAEAKFHKDNSGFITPNPRLSGQPRNTMLSAVISAQKKWNNNQCMYDMKVYHNPWSVNPLPEKVFEKMPQFIKTESKPGYISMKWKNENKLVYFK